MRFGIPHLEMHLSHVCNLKCKHCSHYCDFSYDQPIPLQETLDSMRRWSARLVPKGVFLMGGEPLLNKDLLTYLDETPKIFPHSQIALLTNAVLLAKWGEPLAEALKRNRIKLIVSIHPRPEQAEAAFKKSIRYLEELIARLDFIVEVRDAQEQWGALHLGQGRSMLPCQSNPIQAREICCSKDCINLHQGKLWHCPTLAYLPLIAGKLKHKEAWQQYLTYKPLSPDAGDREIQDFLTTPPLNFCSACPDKFMPAPHVYEMAR